MKRQALNKTSFCEENSYEEHYDLLPEDLYKEKVIMCM